MKPSAPQGEVQHAQGRRVDWGTVGKALAALGIVALATALIYAWRSGVELERLGALGYPGAFLVAFLAAATVLVPVPGFVVIAGAGAIWHPALVGLAAGLGAATGELVGFAAGRTGRAALKGRRGDRWQTAETWLRRFGFWAILALAALPNPFFDALGLAAGALAYPPGRFWLASALGNSLKHVTIAYIGGSIAWPLG